MREWDSGSGCSWLSTSGRRLLQHAGGVRTRSPGVTHVGSAGATDMREECREHPGEDRNIMFHGAARDAQLPCPAGGSDLTMVT